MGGRSDHPGISLRDAWRAARTVRASECGGRAYSTVRPRGVSGILRWRAPLFLVLWGAARQDADGFALLQPPRDDRAWRSATGDPRLALLRLADRHWDLLLFFVPPALLLVLSAGLVLAFHTAAVLLTVLLLMVVVTTYTALMLAAMLVHQVATGLLAVLRGRDAEAKAAKNAPFEEWTLHLCHQAVPSRLGALIDEVSERLHRLIVAGAEEAARRRGVEVRSAEAAETLACLLDGATSEDVRDGLLAATYEERGRKVVFLVRAGGRRTPARRVPNSGLFLFGYLAGMAVYVLAEAVMIPGWERPACAAAGCADRPADFTSALSWASLQLLGWAPLTWAGLDLPGPVAQSGEAGVLGALSGGMTLVLPGVAFTAVRVEREKRKEAQGRHKERVTKVTAKTRVLVMVASDLEHGAVCDAVRRVHGKPPAVWWRDRYSVFSLGAVSAAEVLLVQCGQGSLGPGASTTTAQAVLADLKPDFLVLAGIGYGLMPDEQGLGDVLVCTQMRVMDHKEIADSPLDGAPPITFHRGPRPDASVMLVDRARTARRLDWPGPAVHFGPMLAMNTRISSQDVARGLAEAEPDAIGGEMEGSGIYAAAERAKVDWIVIKGISDWGDRDGSARADAAGAAAAFVVHMIKSGGLNQPPGR